MAYNYAAVGNPPLPAAAINPPPPPPPMTPLQMGMMASQQHMPMTAGHLMAAQGYLVQGQHTPPAHHQQQMHVQIQMQHGMLNPAMNDAPLEFNMNKNKPPMPVAGEERNISTSSVATSGREDSNSNQTNNTSGGGSVVGSGGGVASVSASGAVSNSNSGNDSRRDRDRRGRNDRRERSGASERERDRDRDRDRERDRERDRDRSERSARQDETSSVQAQAAANIGAANMTSPSTPAPNASAGLQATGMWPGVLGHMGYPAVVGVNVMGSGMMTDPGMMSIGQMGQYGMMSGMMAEGTIMTPDATVMPTDSGMISSAPVVKEIIHCKSCTLFPPNPNAPPPTTRERPPGCRTIFVGGLPENTTEEIIREIFERCGEMTTVRLSKKNFCHIRFVFESSVDAAIYLSGYRIRIGSNTDAPNSGRLHVDYAQARDDLYEWECRQRALQREQRHRERMEQERMRPPSPPPVVHYTDHEAIAVSEKIKADDSFTKAVQVVITWLERGDCNKRNANTFYTMIQSTNSHVRRLLNEKAQYDEELQRAKELMKGRMQGILIQFGQIERVFSAASHKKVWDHFTKAQRKNIEMWKKQTAEIKAVQLEEVLNERADEEMEVSDAEDDFSGHKKKSRYDTDDRSTLNALREENDSLRCQLEAYKNEVDLVRSDLRTELDQKDKQLKVLQQTLQGMQQQLLESRRRQNEDEIKVRELQARLKTSNDNQVKLQAAAAAAEQQTNAESGISDSGDTSADGDDSNKIDTTQLLPRITDREAKLIGLISTFLHVHPFGAGVDYVWSYLQKLEPNLRPGEVETLMSRFPTVFHQELSGIGANMERRWLFTGFEPKLST